MARRITPQIASNRLSNETLNQQAKKRSNFKTFLSNHGQLTA
jgi:hypothetical protein